MKKNEGMVDRALRVVAGLAALVAAFLWLGLADAAIGGIIVALVGVVLLGTGAVGVCPAYRILGLSTCPLSKKPMPDAHG